MECDFCQEAKGVISAEVHLRYPELQTRTVSRSANLFAVPTLGQLFPNSLLLISNAHIERFSDAPELHLEVEDVLTHLSKAVSAYGHPLIYEHGAKCERDGGCGIYHAHAHVVPIPYQMPLSQLIGRPGEARSNRREAWSSADPDQDYLVVSLGEDTIFCPGGKTGFGSQFMRKRITEEFHLERPWDWRAYMSREDDFDRSLQNFETAS